MNPGIVVSLVFLAWLVLGYALAWVFGHFCRVGAREEDQWETGSSDQA
jgi:hypothetical protein